MLQVFSQINYLAVLVAAILYFVIGAAWYAPQLLGNAWMKERGLTPQDIQGGASPALLGGTFLLILIGCLITGYVVQASGASGIVNGLLTGLFMGIGFVATSIGITFMYESRTLKLFLIDAGYHMTGLIVAGIILALWP